MHPLTPLNGNSINYRPGSQIGGPGFNDSSAALMQLRGLGRNGTQNRVKGAVLPSAEDVRPWTDGR